nr:reverse transcriptase domain-containing protein [Tanacetum cinerariifolium]
MADKFNREKEKGEKLKELKDRLNFEGCSGTSWYSESKTMSTKEHEKRHRSRRSRSPRTSVFSRIRHERSRSPIRPERSRSPIRREKWQLQIMKERRYFHHGNSMRAAKIKTSKNEVFGTKKGRKGREDEGAKGPMIIEAEIGGHCVHPTTPLIGFNGEIIWPIRQIQLLVKIGDEEHSASAWMNFMVVRSQFPYNGIIGRPGVRKLLAVPSTAHEMLKILV